MTNKELYERFQEMEIRLENPFERYVELEGMKDTYNSTPMAQYMDIHEAFEYYKKNRSGIVYVVQYFNQHPEQLQYIIQTLFNNSDMTLGEELNELSPDQAELFNKVLDNLTKK